MIKVNKTRSGWNVTVTHECDGMLEQGGLQNHKVLYKTSTLKRAGLCYTDDPYGDYNGLVTNVDALLEYEPDRILRRGDIIY